MLEFKMMRHRSTAWLLAFLCASHLIASAQSTTSKSKPCNRFDSEYESVLDAYFIHVRGNIDSVSRIRNCVRSRGLKKRFDKIFAQQNHLGKNVQPWRFAPEFG